jgi:hypothetical protein
MHPADVTLRLRRVGEPIEFADIRACDETRFLARVDDQSLDLTIVLPGFDAALDLV